MDLAVNPPIKPMLAKAVPQMPDGGDVIFEPKWDGFRCLIFRDGDEVVLGSRNEKPLTRYFPEMIEPIKKSLPKKCVIDGELILAIDNHIEFDSLQQRIHPAESRVNMLAEKTPAMFVAFDILCHGSTDLRDQPFEKRRAQLEKAMKNAKAPIFLTPTTTDTEIATRWFKQFEGAGLDGLIAKPIGDPYAENKRSQQKIKHVRTADAVVAGYRIHKDGAGVGSLLLGLHNDDGELRHVGVAASFTKVRRSELVEELKPLTENALTDHPWRSWGETNDAGQVETQGAPNRWSAAKAKTGGHAWTPLRIELVAEVKYGSTLNDRFREVTKMLRWRPDKTPAECTFDQLDEPIPVGLDTVLGA